MIELDAQTVTPPYLRLVPSLPETDTQVSVTIAPAAVLDARFDRLGERFALPALSAAPEAPEQHELAMLARMDLLDTAYVACLVACAMRCTAGGMPLAFGAWAGSALLAWSGAMLPCDEQDGVAVADVEQRRQLFLEAVAEGAAGAPRLLAPWPLGDATLAILRAELPGWALTCEELHGGLQRLTWMPITDAQAQPANSGEAAATPALIMEIVPSRLCRAVVTAQLWAERLDGPWIDLVDIPAQDDQAALLLASGWAAVLPELPAWVRALSPVDGGLEALRRCWLAAAPRPLNFAESQALRCRASLVWCLAYVATRTPRAGWLALLTTCAPADLPAMARAAGAAGFALLPPSVQGSGVEWEPDAAEELGLRAGLSSIPAAAAVAPAIVARREADGPYQSVFDLARRVPDLPAEPVVLRQLVLAGALDELHDRGVLLALWPAVSAWCAASAALQPGAPPLPEPVLDGMEPIPPERLDIWARGVVPLARALAATESTPMTIDDALVPAALRASPPPAGTTVRLAGALIGYRRLIHDDRELLLLEIGDGTESVLVLAPQNEPEGNCLWES
ncbi:MAG TPA: hypothetical protein VHB98_14175, partial [Chloroflexota bacterium]|nr:hypothetical protein [Chloroflexota bacterium]